MQATPSPPAFDHRGRALPLPAEEERRHATEAPRALEALAGTGDDEEQGETFAALADAIDRDRLSDRRRRVAGDSVLRNLGDPARPRFLK